VYGQPRPVDVGVALDDGRLAVPIVIEAADPGVVRAGGVAASGHWSHADRFSDASHGLPGTRG
jgi:hypothetical protein